MVVVIPGPLPPIPGSFGLTEGEKEATEPWEQNMPLTQSPHP